MTFYILLPSNSKTQSDIVTINLPNNLLLLFTRTSDIAPGDLRTAQING